MFDIIIVGWGASGLFLASLLWSSEKVLILEKTDRLWTKVLLSGKGRCNFTNKKVVPQHYLGDQTETLQQLFETFGAREMIAYLEANGIESKEEENWRILLKSNKSSEIVNFFLKKITAHQHAIKTWTEVHMIKKTRNGFEVSTNQGKFQSSNIVIASGGCSFPKVGASHFIFEIAEAFWIQAKKPAPALCGIMSLEKVNSLSWSGITAQLQVFDQQGMVFETEGNILFTHRGISGPAVFNTANWLGYHYEEKLKKLAIKLIIPADQMTKRLFAFLRVPRKYKSYMLTLHPTWLRPRDEAKAMSWGILMDEINQHFEVKKIPGMFILGEALNIIGETGGFNLQRCRTSAYHCANYLL